MASDDDCNTSFPYRWVDDISSRFAWFRKHKPNSTHVHVNSKSNPKRNPIVRLFPNNAILPIKLLISMNFHRNEGNSFETQSNPKTSSVFTTTLYYIALHCTALHCTALCHAALHCAALYHTVLHCATLYYNTCSTIFTSNATKLKVSTRCSFTNKTRRKISTTKVQSRYNSKKSKMPNKFNVIWMVNAAKSKVSNLNQF